MSLQLGFLARLTWWEYSWDIGEEVDMTSRNWIVVAVVVVVFLGI